MTPAAAKMLHTGPVPHDVAASALDRAHLARMTFGDRSLERELLQLFDRQAEMLLGRMGNGDPAAVGALAHTLKGSAVGVGAFGVAQAAAAVEQAQSGTERRAAIDALAQAVTVARAEIAVMLAG